MDRFLASLLLIRQKGKISGLKCLYQSKSNSNQAKATVGTRRCCIVCVGNQRTKTNQVEKPVTATENTKNSKYRTRA